MAAVVRNEANRNGGGYVAAIGVRRPWRGKGYAKALLLHTFREFYNRGIKRVTLGVDAENPTGARHLYERAGMHVQQENVVFEKSFA
jgi:ribosomal protein S18 acetylase RimI-like enzyme